MKGFVPPATVGRLSPSGDRVAYLRVTDPQGTVTLAETDESVVVSPAEHRLQQVFLAREMVQEAGLAEAHSVGDNAQ